MKRVSLPTFSGLFQCKALAVVAMNHSGASHLDPTAGIISQGGRVALAL